MNLRNNTDVNEFFRVKENDHLLHKVFFALSVKSN
jgi:hypothetical protein